MMDREDILRGNLMVLVYEPHKLSILRHLREHNDTQQLYALEHEQRRKDIVGYFKTLLVFGLIERLPRPQSPYKPDKKSRYQPYGITVKGLALLAEYEKKPNVTKV